MEAKGRVFKYGDNVDTDVIIPARYLNSFDAKELATHAMVDLDPTFVERVQQVFHVLSQKALHVSSIVTLLILVLRFLNVQKP